MPCHWIQASISAWTSKTDTIYPEIESIWILSIHYRIGLRNKIYIQIPEAFAFLSKFYYQENIRQVVFVM